MKNLIMTFVIFASAAANASTISEKRVSEMTIILNSQAVQSLLQQEDEVGNIEGISFMPSMTEASNYEIQFSSYSGSQAQSCIVVVSISNTSVALGNPSCKVKAALPPSDTKICANPSPIGCLDSHK